MGAEYDESDGSAVSDAPSAMALRTRVSDQAAEHWREFAVITASGGVLVVIATAGLLLTRSIAFDAVMLLVGMLFVSIAAFVLAYFSMQVGAVTLTGPITLQDIVTSFLIAASQLAMPLWIGNLLRQDRIDGIAAVLPGARHWFGLFACFALSAAYANAYAATRRRRQSNDAGILNDYELAQRDDRRGAFCCGLVAAVAWASMLWCQPAPAVLGALIAVFAIGVGKAIGNQSTTMRRLADALDPVMQAPQGDAPRSRRSRQSHASNSGPNRAG
jgi:hypothetical protein